MDSGDRFELIDRERIDLDALIDRSQRSDVYPTDEWVDYVESNMNQPEVGTVARFPDEFDSEEEWLLEELQVLFIRSHRETDLGVTEYSGALQAMAEQSTELANVGLTSYAMDTGQMEKLESYSNIDIDLAELDVSMEDLKRQ